MKMTHRVAIGAAFAGAFALGGAAHAANLSLNDATPGEITNVWQDFDWDGGSTQGSPLVNSDSRTVAGEMATSYGSWQVNTTQNGSGVIYIVDPGQPNLVRARIDGWWSALSPNSIAEITITVTSSPFGGNLGALPPAFAGLGVPMPDGSIDIQTLFRDTTTGALVPIPSNLTMQYVGDLVPECPHPTLLLQAPNQGSVNRSDTDGLIPFEQADDVQFTQDVVIRSMRWWGILFGSGTAEVPDQFTMHVYEDAGGVPASMPVSTHYLSNAIRTGTGLTISGAPEFVYSVNLSAPLALKANTRYWLAIINDTAADTDDDWYWSSSAVGNNARAERTPPLTGAWTARTTDRALELCGDTMSLDCPTDFDGDGFTSGADLAVLLANWGPCGPPLPLVVPTEPARLDMLTNTADDPSAATGAQR